MTHMRCSISRRASALLAVAILLTLSAPSPIIAASASGGAAGSGPQSPRSSVFRLAGSNHLSARGTAATEVIVPQEASLSSEIVDNPDVSLRGKGRQLTLVLREQGAGVYRSLLFATRFDFCRSSRCDDYLASETFVNSTGFDRSNNRIVIPAGRYNLFLITDGPSVKAALRLDALTDDLRLELSSPAPSSLAFHALEPEGAMEESNYSFEDSHRFRSSVGLAFAALLIEDGPRTLATEGACLFRGAHPWTNHCAMGSCAR